MKTVQTQHAVIFLANGETVEYRDDITLIIDKDTGVQVWQPALELASYTWGQIDEAVGITWAP